MNEGHEKYLRERSHSPENDRSKPFSWRLPLYAAAGACVVLLPIMVYGSADMAVLYTFGAAPIIAILLLVVVAVRRGLRRRLSALLALVAYVTVTGALFMARDELRPTLRWLLWSHRYKAQLLAVPHSANGELKHIEWDGWGWAGQDTVVYLVFDPTDSLSGAAKSHSPGKFRGMPCEVFRVQRLESHWYSVVFYTNTDWAHRP
jgi:hypothetical protein